VIEASPPPLMVDRLDHRRLRPGHRNGDPTAIEKLAGDIAENDNRICRYAFLKLRCFSIAVGRTQRQEQKSEVSEYT
jgi:hypothetical protein